MPVIFRPNSSHDDCCQGYKIPFLRPWSGVNGSKMGQKSTTDGQIKGVVRGRVSFGEIRYKILNDNKMRGTAKSAAQIIYSQRPYIAEQGADSAEQVGSNFWNSAQVPNILHTLKGSNRKN